MNCRLSPTHRAATTAIRPSAFGVRHFRRGYSFAELLFAVVVLGIGFILVAAMFPVAISASKSTQDESTAAAVARGAIDQLREIAQTRIASGATTVSLLPATADNGANGRPSPMVYSLFSNAAYQSYAASPAPVPAAAFPNPVAWSRVRGSVVSSADPRFGWVALYRRGIDSAGAPDGYAHVVLFVLRTQVGEQYGSADAGVPVETPTPAKYVNLQAKPVTFRIVDADAGAGAEGADTIQFTGGNTDAATTGAFVVVSDDYSCYGTDTTVRAANQGRLNGRIYRVGPAISDAARPNLYALQPGYDFISEAPIAGITGSARLNGIPVLSTGQNGGVNVTGQLDAAGFVVGRTYDSGTFNYAGNAQDIAVYTTVIAAN